MKVLIILLWRMALLTFMGLFWCTCYVFYSIWTFDFKAKNLFKDPNLKYDPEVDTFLYIVDKKSYKNKPAPGKNIVHYLIDWKLKYSIWNKPIDWETF